MVDGLLRGEAACVSTGQICAARQRRVSCNQAGFTCNRAGFTLHPSQLTLERVGPREIALVFPAKPRILTNGPVRLALLPVPDIENVAVADDVGLSFEP